MAFARRFLRATFGLSGGNFASGSNSTVAEGLRISAKVSRSGSSAALMDCSIFGMSLQEMNQLTELGWGLNAVSNNTIVLEAKSGEDGNYATVFSGTVNFAWIDGQSQPQLCFRVSAGEGGPEAAKSVPVSSYDGPTDVVTVLKNLASQASPPLTFVNHGVKVILSSPYFSGSLGTQIYEAIEHAGIVGGIVDNHKLEIRPKNMSSNGDEVIITPTTGLVGYPAFTRLQMIAKMEYNPNIVFNTKLTVKDSQITVANRTWTIGSLTHDLESETPKGMWYTTAVCADPSLSSPIPQGT